MKKTVLFSILLAVLILTGASCTFQPIPTPPSDSDQPIPTPPSDSEQACPGVWSHPEEQMALTGKSEDISFFYTIPRWYERKMNFVDIRQVKFGNEIEIYAKIMPWLADMKDVQVAFSTPEGLRIVKGGEDWTGDIKKCEIKEFKVTVKWESQPDETQRFRIYFEYDFPKKELLNFVEANKEMRYDNSELRSDFVDFINEQEDRRSDSLTAFIQ